jgi:endonuclease/exonuclease/phosphatase family metal-dependent hydrolase
MRLIIILLFLGISNVTNAQFTENFDNPVKGGYADGTAALSSGTWFLAEALIGNLAADQKNGSHSVRMGSALPSFGSRVQMQFDVASAGTVEFYYGTYITDGNNDRHSVIQLQQSVDGGFTWTNVGSSLTTSNDFRLAQFEINHEGNIRFRIVKLEGGTSASRTFRVNIDDFTVTEYIEPFADARIRLSAGQEDINTEESFSYSFPPFSPSTSRDFDITITNTGQETLTVSAFISEQSIFSVIGEDEFSLGFRESAIIRVQASGSTPGLYSSSLVIDSNDPATPQVSIGLSAEILDGSIITPIVDARNLPFGTIVTVTGWVSTANEFGGPIFIQDRTGGIAVFHNPIHTAVSRGDSVVVTGPLSEFNPTGQNQGQFLRQITGSGTTFTVHPEGNRTLTPRLITLAQMNAGCCESQLVQIEGAEFTVSGNFPSNTQNFTIVQNGNQALIRIDTRSDFANAPIPSGSVNIIGVVDRFNGTYQLKPRDTRDLGVEAYENPFADISKDETFDIATWNIEWFGDRNNGPQNVALQIENVIKVIETMDMDVYALQEIADQNAFNTLVGSLENYRGFISNYSQSQKVAWLYKTSTIDSISTAYVAESGRWANGRIPFQFEFDATINGETRRIKAVNFHAKAFASQDDYNQRRNDAIALKQYADSRKASDRMILIGDYNDDVITSTWAGLVTPYEMFNTDPDYTIVTKSLSEQGFTSYRSVSMIDHITINSNLYDEYLFGAEQIENTGYIGSYLTTTSDHYPVWTRFKFEAPVSVENPDAIPDRVTLNQNYPNPFNPSTVIGFSLPTQDSITLEVYDVTGRLVSSIYRNHPFSAGNHTATFNADSLSSGVYITRLITSNGSVFTNKMVLMK